METGLWAFGVAVVSFAITAVIGKFLIPFLHRLNFGQTILEDGPKCHKNKQGTPTMGGIMFIIGMVIATTAGVLVYAMNHGGLDSVSRFVFVGLLFALMNGGIGFIDDYVKVVKKRNLGLTAIQKLVLQFLAAAIYLFLMYLCKDNTEILIPFVGYVDLGFFYYIIMAVVLVGIVNAVNLTDGIDGLEGSITFFACLFMKMIANVLGGHEANVLYAAAGAGGCLGFLVWNFHPAKCFMGDTGSLFLGGLVCSMAFAMDMQLLLLLIALTYLL
ncbi:MAG: phospho-N-acetylmuramoyl-pentapeptide-transferase, partial [Ruminococcus sp.]|nr:phospho-N-acetylmuramoyl-pentapeptide-transferase [Ruminococcus sp.]